MSHDGYGFGRTLTISHSDALARTREALQQEGFGVITEIDVAATMEEKLGRHMHPYVILGACNPGFAWTVLESDMEMGLLLPCNVIVYETDAGTRVSIADPESMAGLAGAESLESVAAEVKARLRRAVDSL